MYLDPAIRNWVFIPIMLVMILVGILRAKATFLLNNPPKVAHLRTRERQALFRSRLFRSNHKFITKSQFNMRKAYLMESFTNRDYLVVKNYEQAQQNPMGNPEMMNQTVEMMKKNMMMVIPQTIIMSWISYFFSGFVLTRLPFPLSYRFKEMLQRGIETSDMDVRWVSSLSWYFLNLFGLNSVYTLLLGAGVADASSDFVLMQQMQQGNPLEQPQEVARLFNAEVEFLELLNHTSELESVREQVLAKYQKVDPLVKKLQ